MTDNICVAPPKVNVHHQVNVNLKTSNTLVSHLGSRIEVLVNFIFWWIFTGRQYIKVPVVRSEQVFFNYNYCYEYIFFKTLFTICSVSLLAWSGELQNVATSDVSLFIVLIFYAVLATWQVFVLVITVFSANVYWLTKKPTKRSSLKTECAYDYELIGSRLLSPYSATNL